jgi:hypothetical protein
MILQRIRRAAAVLALAATLALAAPVHAAGWKDLTAGSGWFEPILEWITRLWTGGEETGPPPVIEKCGGSLNPDGCPGAAPPPTSTPSAGSGSGG